MRYSLAALLGGLVLVAAGIGWHFLHVGGWPYTVADREPETSAPALRPIPRPDPIPPEMLPPPVLGPAAVGTPRGDPESALQRELEGVLKDASYAFNKPDIMYLTH